jgi:hypothetical protein
MLDQGMSDDMGLDKRSCVRRSEVDQLRRFQPVVPTSGPTLAALERAQAFQQRVFGERVLKTPSAELIEEGRRDRDDQLP